MWSAKISKDAAWCGQKRYQKVQIGVAANVSKDAGCCGQQRFLEMQIGVVNKGTWRDRFVLSYN